MIMSFDIETTGLNPLKDDIVSMQWKEGSKPSEYVDIKDSDWKMKSQQILNDLENPLIKIICHNTIFEWQFIYAKYGIEITNFEDTMILPFVLDRGAPFEYLPPVDFRAKQENNRRKLKSVGLKRLAKHYLNANTWEDDFIESIGTRKDKGIARIVRALFTDTDTPLQEVFKGKGKILVENGFNSKNHNNRKSPLRSGISNSRSFNRMEDETDNRERLYRIFKSYAKNDVKFTLELWNKFKNWPKPECYEIEKRLIPHLAKLQLRGVQIDKQKLDDLGKEYEQIIEETAQQMKRLLNNPDFDPAKKRQYAEALKARGHKLPKTDKGNDATGRKFLVNIKDELKDLMDQYTRACARKRQHIDGIRRETDTTNIYHPNYLSCGTNHGRFASRTENL